MLDDGWWEWLQGWGYLVACGILFTMVAVLAAEIVAVVIIIGSSGGGLRCLTVMSR